MSMRSCWVSANVGLTVCTHFAESLICEKKRFVIHAVLVFLTLITSSRYARYYIEQA